MFCFIKVISYIRNVVSLLELLVVYRFAEVAELIRVCRLEIIAKINTCLLSQQHYTQYTSCSSLHQQFMDWKTNQ
ncbi:hypothetical protein NC652_039067 [Populus alba x Populus x berolinensis]|nr:hypothetical protein NC652_039067 [Populus alba x Populus x berolinensis]